MKLILFTTMTALLCFESTQADSKPFKGKVHHIPGKIEAEDYDEGAPGKAYYDVDTNNLGANYRGVTQVDIEKRSDASNGYGIGWTRKGEWLNYSVDIKETGTYAIEIPVASNKIGGLFVIEIKGKALCKPIHIPDTGGWDKLKLIKRTGVNLVKGRHVIRVVMLSEGESGSIGDIDYFNFTKLSSSSEDISRKQGTQVGEELRRE